MAATKFSKEKYRGCLLGLAIGDAMGAPVEFNEPGSFETIRSFRGGGYFHLKPGEWTDDTALALCSAESLVACKGFNAHDHLSRFLKWYRDGCMSTRIPSFGIGLVTAAALLRFESTGENFCGPTGSKTAENGSLMRIAPIPLYYAKQPKRAMLVVDDGSRITHGARDAVDTCRYLSMLIMGCVGGYPKEEILKPNFDAAAPGEWARAPLTEAVQVIMEGDFLSEPDIDRGNYGSATTAMRAALWAFASTDNFRDGLLRVVNLGWDADTMGAVYGQLAGAYYGESGIPNEWKEKVMMHEVIVQLADALSRPRQRLRPSARS